MKSFRNSKIEIQIRPDLGGRIDQIRDLRTGRDWLWHPTGYRIEDQRRISIGSSFDDNWSGGFDEIFPNDAACEFAGRKLADHGELWSQPWETVEISAQGIRMRRQCQSVPAAVEKTMTLDESEARVTLSYMIKSENPSIEKRIDTLKKESDEQNGVPFLFKLHPALHIDEGDELILPQGCVIEPVDMGFSQIIGKPGRTRFPKAFSKEGEEIEIHRVLPASSGRREFYYASGLTHGECGIKNNKTRTTFMMRFSLTDFPYVWAFQSYGGFQNHYVVILEPCTNIPYDLVQALHQGTSAVLRRGEIQERKLTLSLEKF